VTKKLAAGLLATRSKRVLQTVEFGPIEDAETAALVGELVSTDPIKQWSFRGCFTRDAAVAAFCRAATAAHTSARASSLTKLVLEWQSNQERFAAVLAAVPTITAFQFSETDDDESQVLL
jgi:hypothetical protein